MIGGPERLSVCLPRSLTGLCYANMAEHIKVLLCVETLVLDGSPGFTHGFDVAFAKLLWPLLIIYPW